MNPHHRIVSGLLVAASAACTVMLVSPAAQATTGFIDVSGGVTLNEDHFGWIRVNSNGLLDCQGHSIIATTTLPAACGGSTCAIQIAPFANQAEVRNCNIRPADATTRFFHGIWTEWADRLTLFRNTIDGTAGAGLVILGGSSSTIKIGIRLNYISNSGAEGMVLRNLTSYRIYGNQVFLNARDGADLGSCSFNLIDQNSFAINQINGIELDLGTSNQFLSNYAASNGQHGITLDDANINTLRSNLVESNGGDGIRIQDLGADNDSVNAGNVIDNNVTRFNGLNGISAEDAERFSSTLPRITNNTVNNNGCDGIKVNNFDDGQIAANNSFSNAQYGFHSSGNSSNNLMTPANTWATSNTLGATCGNGASCALLPACPF
jgi:parallel beta-helix repeat protein